MTIWEMIFSIFELSEGNFYVYENTDYWRIKLHWPFIGVGWVPTTLPGQQPINKPIIN